MEEKTFQKIQKNILEKVRALSVEMEVKNNSEEIYFHDIKANLRQISATLMGLVYLSNYHKDNPADLALILDKIKSPAFKLYELTGHCLEKTLGIPKECDKSTYI